MSSWLNRITRFAGTLAAAMLLAALTGCTAETSTSTDVPATPTARQSTATPLSVAQVTPALPTIEQTPESSSNLRVWWPETLAPIDRTEVTNLLDQHISTFVMAEGADIDIDFRLKRYLEVGGIISMLRAASPVAPGALPDLTLVRREDLPLLIELGIVQPLSGVSTAIVEDVYEAGLSLGWLNDQLYGLPYTLDMLMLTYRQGDDDNLLAPTTFDAVLELERPFLFPGRRVNSLNATVLLQYLDAGGSLPDTDGVMILNPEALFAVMSFYENAYRLGLVDSTVFEYTNASEYQTQLTTGSIDMAVVNAKMYLDLRAGGTQLEAASLPTQSGEPITMVNGWIWVLTTTNPDRQQLAIRFINWMMDVNRHYEYASAARVIPSQRVVLQRMDGDLYNSQFITGLLNRAIIQPPDDVIGVIGRSMQTALAAVLSGELTADEAAQAVIDQTSG